ncbi:MAG: hypothetical protein KGZ63_08885 [Clostridiales bacterium]|jgi:hypothetical protein|nr:hypothetical protein [Clostridiales bacterium]
MHFIVPAFGVAFAVLLFILIMGSVFWAHGDAESRGSSGCLVALLVLFVKWPVGLIIWLLIRPKRKLY